MRRVEWVRVVVDAESVHAEAVGIGHRLPTTCRISMDTAAALARQGVPVTVCNDESGEVPSGEVPAP